MVITGDYLLLSLVVLALGLTALSAKLTLILFRLAASISWLALGILLITNTLGTDITDPWTEVLGFLCVVMTIAPLTLQMVTEVRRESKGKFWSEYQKGPVEKREGRRDRIRREHRERMRSRVRR